MLLGQVVTVCCIHSHGELSKGHLCNSIQVKTDVSPTSGFNHISSEQSPNLPESPQVLEVSRNTLIWSPSLDTLTPPFAMPLIVVPVVS